ncbi:MAG: NfeD family protein [Pseudomonadota bacterium]
MGVVTDFVANMPFWYWFMLAAALIALELATGSTYLLWPAGAAALVGLAFPLSGSWTLQIGLFAAATIALSLVGPPYLKPLLKRARHDHHALNDRGRQKIGARCSAHEGFSGGRGRVRYGDTVWLAQTQNGDDPQADALLEIVDVDGVTLVVRPVA